MWPTSFFVQRRDGKTAGPWPERTLVNRSLPENLVHRTQLHHIDRGVIENALRLKKQGRQWIFWIDGIDNYSLREREDLFRFSQGRNDLMQQKKLLRDYRDFER